MVVATPHVCTCKHKLVIYNYRVVTLTLTLKRYDCVATTVMRGLLIKHYIRQA